MKGPLQGLSPGFRAGIAISLVAGVLLRVLFIQDMEWKEDEQLFYQGSQRTDWPWVGMPTGVYILNPGMTYWIFKVLASISLANDPISVMLTVQAFAMLGMIAIIPFALKVFKDAREREPWLWAFVLGMVNPISIVYQRKLWPFSCQLPFTMLILYSWLNRARFAWAFVWGVAGACIGQIHMSGFFLSGGLFLWTALFGRTLRERTSWKGWFLGSVLGALPLIPWADFVLRQELVHGISGGWSSRLEAKYWVFWLTNPLGLHIGNTLGILRGNGNLQQLADFFRHPLLGESPTYLVGIAHAVIFAVAVRFLGGAFVRALRAGNFGRTFRESLIDGNRTAFLLGAAFIASGLLLTATGVNIRRYYLYVVYPLEFVFLARLALNAQPWSGLTPRRLLVTLWVCQLLVSAAFVGYIHRNRGAPQGDYGVAYSAQGNR